MCIFIIHLCSLHMSIILSQVPEQHGPVRPFKLTSPLFVGATKEPAQIALIHEISLFSTLFYFLKVDSLFDVIMQVLFFKIHTY